MIDDEDWYSAANPTACAAGHIIAPLTGLTSAQVN